MQNSYTGFYYPAASYCYAYKPTQELKEFESLNTNLFGVHKWFLPSAAELGLFWYQVHNNEEFINIYYKSSEECIIPSDSFIWTSTEGGDVNKAYTIQFKIPSRSNAKAWFYGSSNGDKGAEVNDSKKSYVLPIVRF